MLLASCENITKNQVVALSTSTLRTPALCNSGDMYIVAKSEQSKPSSFNPNPSRNAMGIMNSARARKRKQNGIGKITPSHGSS